MSDDFENLSIEEIAKKITEVQNILASATKQLNIAQAEVESTEKKMKPLYEEYQKLRLKKVEQEAAIKQIKPMVNDWSKQLADLKHWLSQAQLKKMAAEKFEALSSELDFATASMPWRERAFKHQIEGGKRIALTGGKTILGDKRGLGKSLTGLIALDMLKAQKIIVFAPKETIKNFENEILDWAPHRTLMTMIGKPKEYRDFVLSILPEKEEYILTMNLEAWRRDPHLISQLKLLQVDTVIIDEAHFIKESKTVTAEGIREIIHAQNQCALCGKNNLAFDGKYMACLEKDCEAKYAIKDPNCMSVKHVIPMTGTMILNTPEDLWTLLNIIDEKEFRDKETFLYRYCEKINGKWRFRYGGEKALLDKLGPRLIQRDRKSAGIVIPPQKVQFYDVEFDPKKYPKQYRAYRELQEKWTIFSNSNPEEQMTVNYAIAHLTRLRQMMTWPASIVWREPISKAVLFQCDVSESIKIDWAVDLIKELVEEGERVILFSQFVPPLQELHRRLSKTPVETQGDRLIRPALLYGGTTEAERDHIRYDLDRRNNSSDFDIVLGQYRVGGQSLNFTAATQMIILDEEWNPGKNDQAYGRIDRIGQTKDTTVHVPIVNKTVDVFMRQLNELKQQIIDGFEGEINLLDRMNKAIQDGEM